jgi:hypothetical protein
VSHLALYISRGVVTEAIVDVARDVLMFVHDVSRVDDDRSVGLASFRTILHASAATAAPALSRHAETYLIL